MSSFIRSTVVGALLASMVTIGGVVTAAAASTTSTCNTINLSLMKSLGFSKAISPTVTPYSYTNGRKNAANALGTTIDFGSKALIVGCVSPSDIAKLSADAGSPKKALTAAQYMAYMVKQSYDPTTKANAMQPTPVAGTTDYLDFGDGAQDGVGSTLSLGVVRLDAWVVGNYIFLGFSGSANVPHPSAPLVAFMKWTQTHF